MNLPEEYRVARDVFETIRVVPKGHCISRGEINTRLRASSDKRKNDIVSKVIRHMIQMNQIQKRMDRETNAVYFWTLDNMNVKGEKGKWDPAEPLTNYLVDPPPPPTPAPTPVPTPVPAPTQAPVKETIPKALHDQLSLKGKEEFGVESDEDLYMMSDTTSKKHRLLLRPDGETVRLSVEEIEFIKGLKEPYVTL